MFFVTVLTGSETGPKFPLATRPVKQSGLWKFWPLSGTIHEGEEKSLNLSLFLLGFKSRSGYWKWLLSGLKQDLLQFGHAEEKSSGDSRFSLPVALKAE